MTRQPYHEYVFDSKKRNFVGKFEEMYQAEDKKIFDSWFQSDLTHLGKQLSIAILSRYNLNAILDIGCWTGSFTHLLKNLNNRVIGADISKTAINKAKAKYRGVEFIAANADEAIEKCAGGALS